MNKDQFIAQAVIAGKTRAQALALYAVAFPDPEFDADEVVGFKREVFPDGRIIETETLGDGRERVTSQKQGDE